MSQKLVSFKREDFVKRFVSAGLSYEQAAVAYVTMMTSLESAVADRRKVVLGSLGTLVPKPMPPRRVVMSCKGGQVGPTKTKKEFFLGARTKYRFVMHESFGQRHGFTT